jgi:(1->4)-alpha-D-glucan 1-alpha-D-glucosylmutase
VQDYAWRAAELISKEPFLERVRDLGRRLSLAQLLLKLAAPGVPDVYRGDELEDLSLVDPDNRRAVDWEARQDALRVLQDGGPVTHANVKLYVMWKTLGLRSEHASAFAGSYDAVDAGDGVCAFVRGGEVLVAAALRPGATVRVPEGWHDVLGVEGLALCVRPAREVLVGVV